MATNENIYEAPFLQQLKLAFTAYLNMLDIKIILT